ncbi:MAG: DUF1294 domain-containing protein [Eubacteriales bacterium]|nr:DUF1294 domain-containing protein [Eubacteriales bacterium]
MKSVVFIYIVIMNPIGIAAMGIDKAKAKHHAWRIPEKVLFGLSILGGSIGTLASTLTMSVWRM